MFIVVVSSKGEPAVIRLSPCYKFASSCFFKQMSAASSRTFSARNSQEVAFQSLRAAHFHPSRAALLGTPARLRLATLFHASGAVWLRFP